MGDKSSTLKETCFYKVKTSKMNKEDVDNWYSLFLNQRTNVRMEKLKDYVCAVTFSFYLNF